MGRRDILIIEDNPEIANLVALHLDDSGYAAHQAASAECAFDKITQQKFDLIVLDLMLPGMDGMEFCRRFRAEEPDTPILILSARTSEIDRVLGLELGADDYLTKPFSVRELTARIKAILRRVDKVHVNNTQAAQVLELRDLILYPDKRLVKRNSQSLELTAKEFDLLQFFLHHPGRVFSRAQLLDQVWGHHHEGYEHTVNSHINRLRAKIEADPSNPQYILTVWGVGYKFSEQ